MTEIKAQNRMGSMPVGRLLLKMSWPAMISMTMQSLYNIVNSIYIGMVGEAELAVITVINPVQMLMISFAVGTGVGINSLISRRLGARRIGEASLAASNGLRLAFVNWILFAICGNIFAKMFMEIYFDDPYLIAQGRNYIMIVTSGCIFMMMQIIIEKIIQSTGNMLLPMLASITGVIINAGLDPILIFGLLGAPKLGITGAAIATIIAQCLASSLGLFILFKKNHTIKVSLKEKFDKTTLKDIYSVGLPSILMQGIMSFALFCLNVIIGTFAAKAIKESAIAVLGVFGRLQSFVFMPVFGINQGAMPVFGYNYGAKSRVRLVKAFKTAFGMALIVMTVGLILFQTIPGTLLSLFSATDNMYEIGIPAFRIISLCFLPAAISIISAAFFGATGHGMLSLFGTLIRQLVGLLPLAIILGNLGGVEMIWWAYPIAEILGATYCILMLRRLYQKEIIHLDVQEL